MLSQCPPFGIRLAIYPNDQENWHCGTGRGGAGPGAAHGSSSSQQNTLGGNAIVLAPSECIATGKYLPKRNHACFDLYVVDDRGYPGLMIEQCAEIDFTCPAEEVPKRDAVLRYLSGRLKHAHLEIRALDEAKAFVNNIAHFDHDNKRIVRPSLP